MSVAIIFTTTVNWKRRKQPKKKMKMSREIINCETLIARCLFTQMNFVGFFIVSLDACWWWQAIASSAHRISYFCLSANSHEISMQPLVSGGLPKIFSRNRTTTTTIFGTHLEICSFWLLVFGGVVSKWEPNERMEKRLERRRRRNDMATHHENHPESSSSSSIAYDLYFKNKATSYWQFTKFYWHRKLHIYVFNDFDVGFCFIFYIFYLCWNVNVACSLSRYGSFGIHLAIGWLYRRLLLWLSLHLFHLEYRLEWTLLKLARKKGWNGNACSFA